MTTPIKIKRSGTTTSTPSSLDHGELAINYADATLFWKDSSNTIQSFVFQAYASATHKSTHATGGSDALTPSDIGAAPAASPTFTGTATFGQVSFLTFSLADGATLGDFPDNVVTPYIFTTNGAGSDFGGQAGHLVLQPRTNANRDIIFAGGSPTTSELVRIVGGSGRVGIGRTSPATALDVNGVITVSATSGSAGSYAPSLTFSGDPNTGFGQVSGQSDTASVFTAGHERVRVKSGGAVRFVPLSADPASGEAGDVYYNSSSNKLRVYNGTSWVDLH